VAFKELEKNIKFEIWDTAGQEKYRSITKIFYKDANVAILVYDVSRKESFEEIKNYWYQQVKDNSPKKISINSNNKSYSNCTCCK
jgi:small GTP-binding protein